MTDKQIIIDECIHLDEWKHCDICEKLIKTKDGANGKKREHLLTEEDLRCDFYPNCHYKQLLRKEQECEELKKINQELMKYRKHSTTCQECYEDGLEDGKTNNKELRKLRKTLAEIKEIITTALEQNTLINLNKILQKINEDENEKNNS